MLFIILSAIFFLLGFSIHKLKWYFLISGYNTMPKERKKNVNTEGLGRLMGFYGYFMGVLFLIVALLEQFDVQYGFTVFAIIFGVTTVVVLVRAQKFDGNLFDENGKWRKGASKHLKQPAIIVGITIIVASVLIYLALQPTNVQLQNNALIIDGMYGDTYAYSDISDVTLLEKLPDISYRSNGSAVGSQLQGYFKLKNGETVKLFIDASAPPFISFKHKDKTIIFNLSNADETKNIYESLQQK